MSLKIAQFLKISANLLFFSRKQYNQKIGPPQKIAYYQSSGLFVQSFKHFSS